MYIINNTEFRLIGNTINEKTNDALLFFVNKKIEVPITNYSKLIFDAIGSDVFKKMISYNNFENGDVYTFNSGNLDYDIIIPILRIDENIEFEKKILKQNIFNVLKAYGRNYPLRKITILIPNIYSNELIKEILLLLSSRELNLNLVNILYENIDDYIQIEKILKKERTVFVFNKFFDKMIEKIANLF